MELELRTWNWNLELELRTWNLELGTGTSNMEPGTRDARTAVHFQKLIVGAPREAPGLLIPIRRPYSHTVACERTVIPSSFNPSSTEIPVR